MGWTSFAEQIIKGKLVIVRRVGSNIALKKNRSRKTVIVERINKNEKNK